MQKKLLLYFFIALSWFFHTTCVSGMKPQKKTALSLNEAILLAVRQNPNVQSSKLDYFSQKFNLFIQRW